MLYHLPSQSSVDVYRSDAVSNSARSDVHIIEMQPAGGRTLSLTWMVGSGLAQFEAALGTALRMDRAASLATAALIMNGVVLLWPFFDFVRALFL